MRYLFSCWCDVAVDNLMLAQYSCHKPALSGRLNHIQVTLPFCHYFFSSYFLVTAMVVNFSVRLCVKIDLL